MLDAFCAAGGAAMGYYRAGWDVVGVDIEPQPDYPFEFHRGDAFEVGRELLSASAFDAVHLSPPCQGEGGISKGTMKLLADKHPRLIPGAREFAEASGLPYVIENVTGSDVRGDVVLCGEMFGLGIIGHRKFELGRWAMPQPVHVPHRGYVRGWRHGVWRDGPYVAAYGKGGGKATVAEMQQAKGVDWTSDHLSLRDAIAPAYTEYIGAALLARLGVGAQA